MPHSRPASLRPLFTAGYYEGSKPFALEKLRPNRRGPVLHAGQRVACVIPGVVSRPIRPVWKDDFGALRIGRTGDMIQMLLDLGISDRAF